MKFILGFLLLSLFAIPARAQSSTSDGNYLLESCRISLQHVDSSALGSHLDAFRDGTCVGLVSGVASVSPKVCASEGVTLGQSVRVVYKYLQDHPEKLNLRDAQLIEEALSRAFPCKQ
jgi:Rap1a immunity proteins